MFTLWTHRVKFGRVHMNGGFFTVICLDAYLVHTHDWIAVQPDDNVGLFSSYLRHCAYQRRQKAIDGMPDYIETNRYSLMELLP